MDENQSTKQPQAAQAPPLSADFRTGSTASGLERLRARLLDLTNRNRLLNFRHGSASSLRVVDADLDVVFQRLVNGEELPFQPVPEPETSATDFELTPLNDSDGSTSPPKPLAADYAESLGWRMSYDLEECSAQNSASECLPVLHFVEGLDTLTRKIAGAARTVIEESGTNMLYLTFGFLEWYESDDSRQPHLAPLLTVPVALNRKATQARGCSNAPSNTPVRT